MRKFLKATYDTIKNPDDGRRDSGAASAPAQYQYSYAPPPQPWSSDGQQPLQQPSPLASFQPSLLSPPSTGSPNHPGIQPYFPPPPSSHSPSPSFSALPVNHPSTPAAQPWAPYISQAPAQDNSLAPRPHSPLPPPPPPPPRRPLPPSLSSPPLSATPEDRQAAWEAYLLSNPPSGPTYEDRQAAWQAHLSPQLSPRPEDNAAPHQPPPQFNAASTPLDRRSPGPSPSGPSPPLYSPPLRPSAAQVPVTSDDRDANWKYGNVGVTLPPRALSDAAIPTLPRKVSEAQNPVKVRKILSLDGGGVRGLSAIMILKYLMATLEDLRGCRVEPWQEFDMIGGTSTGGLLAIMLGRLRMSLDDCEAAYLNLSREIFTPTRSTANVPGKVFDFLQANGKFDSRPLERSIATILRGQGKSEDELLKETDQDSCKV